MAPRDRLILALCLVGMFAAAFLLWGRSVEANPLPSETLDLPADSSDDPALVAPPTTERQVAPITVGITSDEPPHSSAPSPLGVSEWREGTGTIHGYLRMSVDLLRDIRVFTIQVEEERNDNVPSSNQDEPRFQVSKAFKIEGGFTPRFTFEDVPFSRYGYRVSVHVPRYNGSFRVLRLDAGRPEVDEEDCVLSITRGVPYSVRLRDQLYRPVVDTKIRLEPTGEERGLFAAEGVTDSFGNVLFEQMLQGTYRVYVGDPLTPHIEPPEVRVMGHTPVFANKPVEPQGTVIEVPTGQRLVVEVLTRGTAIGIEGIEVEARAIDTTRSIRLAATSDFGGYARFPHVIAGQYQVSVRDPRYHLRDRTVTVEENVPPDTLRIELVPR